MQIPITEGEFLTLAAAWRQCANPKMDMVKLRHLRGLANVNSAGAAFGAAKKKFFDAADELAARGQKLKRTATQEVGEGSKKKQKKTKKIEKSEDDSDDEPLKDRLRKRTHRNLSLALPKDLEVNNDDDDDDFVPDTLQPRAKKVKTRPSESKNYEESDPKPAQAEPSDNIPQAAAPRKKRSRKPKVPPIRANRGEQINFVQPTKKVVVDQDTTAAPLAPAGKKPFPQPSLLHQSISLIDDEDDDEDDPGDEEIPASQEDYDEARRSRGLMFTKPNPFSQPVQTSANNVHNYHWPQAPSNPPLASEATDIPQIHKRNATDPSTYSPYMSEPQGFHKTIDDAEARLTTLRGMLAAQKRFDPARGSQPSGQAKTHASPLMKPQTDGAANDEDEPSRRLDGARREVVLPVKKD